MTRRTPSFDGSSFSTEQLAAGGSGPKNLTGVLPIEGHFKVILATGGNMVIAQLEIDGAVDPQWSGETLYPLELPLFFGTRTVTKITLTSGKGRAYAA